MGGGGKGLRVHRDGLDLLGEFGAGEPVLPDHPRTAGGADLGGVEGLVIVGGDRQRNQDRRAADGGQFGHGRGSGPADEQVGIGQPLGHVLEIGAKFGRDFVAGIAIAHCLDILGPALLGHLQAVAQRGRQHGQAIGHHLAEDPCALAAAGHQHPQQAILAESRERLFAQCQHLGADRVADQMDLVGMFGLEPLDLAIGGSDRVHPPGEEAVDPAQHRVLFVNYAGDPGRSRRPQRRKGRIAAKADHRAGLEAVEQTQRHPLAFEDRLDPLGPVQRVLAQPPGRQDMRDQRMRLARQAAAAVVGDQRHVMPAPLQLYRQGKGRDQVPAGAAGRQDIVPGRTAHSLMPTLESLNRSRRMKGLRRVIESRKPTPRHSAMVEEPP